MMGPRKESQPALFYEFDLDRHVPRQLKQLQLTGDVIADRLSRREDIDAVKAHERGKKQDNPDTGAASDEAGDSA